MDNKGCGEGFHWQTSIKRRGAAGIRLTVSSGTDKGKEKFSTNEIPLLPPNRNKFRIEEAIAQRRSFRNFSDKPITQEYFGNLLWAAQGVTGRRHGHPLHAAPSGGGLYPFEIYIFINHVEGFDPGLYHYAAKTHGVRLIKPGDFRQQLLTVGLGQELFQRAGVVFVLGAVFERICAKYGERGYRYVYMEAGHISQNIFLMATSLGLGSVPVGAFCDQELNGLIGMDGAKQAAIYIHAVGSR
jgi:SagB-type dehydrogenase family enzyme